MAVTAVILASAVSAGTSIYGAQQASKANKEAKTAAGEQKAQQDKLLADAEKQQADMAANESGNAARDAARKKQKQAAAASSGRSDTILTGALGLTDEPTTQKKTILGG